MNKKWLSLILGLILSLTVKAQEADAHKWQANLYAGIYLENEQAWIVEPSVSWHFHKYLGVSAGLEFTSQYNQPSRSTNINGYPAALIDNCKDIGWMIFKPSLIVKTPAINLNTDGDCQLWFQAEPGISLACPFKNSVTYKIYEFNGAVGTVVDYMKFPNKDLRCFYWNARISANLALNRFVIGLGYGISDFDYYSCRRNIRLQNGGKFHVPKKQISQNIVLSIGYRF